MINIKQNYYCFIGIPETICVQKNELSYLLTPLLGQDMTQGQFLSGV